MFILENPNLKTKLLYNVFIIKIVRDDAIYRHDFLESL